MGITPAIATLIAGTAAAGSSVASGLIGANASESNANTQAAAAQAALDFTKAQKAKQEAAFAPYQAISQNALAAPPAQRMVGSAPAPYSSQPNSTMPMPNQAPPMGGGGGGSTLLGMASPQAGAQASPQPPQSQQAGSGPMVLLQAPDGSQKQVPAQLAPAYIARGAKQIG